jgi:hypothetical protein
MAARRRLRIAAVAVVALAVVAACAPRWTYSKPGVTPSRLDQDLEACGREADRPQAFGVTRTRRMDRAAFNRCMEQKGYVVQRDD